METSVRVAIVIASAVSATVLHLLYLPGSMTPGPFVIVVSVIAGLITAGVAGRLTRDA